MYQDTCIGCFGKFDRHYRLTRYCQHCELHRLAEDYRQMPNRGALLKVTTDGRVHNGLTVVTECDSPARAWAVLRRAGFQKTDGGWKLRA